MVLLCNCRESLLCSERPDPWPSDRLEMETRSSGTLSHAAQKILAVLRAQSPDEGRRAHGPAHRPWQGQSWRLECQPQALGACDLSLLFLVEDRDASRRRPSAPRGSEMVGETSRGVEEG